MIGKRIRAAREARGWTQFQLGVVVGKRDTDVSRWERGVLDPRPESLANIARALGVSTDYLLGLKPMDLDPKWVDHSQSGPLQALEQLPAEPAAEQAPRKGRQSRNSA